MKFVPALLLVLFVINTVVMTRLAMSGGVVPPEPGSPSPSATTTIPHRPPPSASVEDLARHYASIPVDELRARLEALDLSEVTIERVLRTRILADAETRVREMAADQPSPWTDLRLNLPAGNLGAPALVTPGAFDAIKPELTLPTKAELLQDLLHDSAAPRTPPPFPPTPPNR